MRFYEKASEETGRLWNGRRVVPLGRTDGILFPTVPTWPVDANGISYGAVGGCGFGTDCRIVDHVWSDCIP